MADPVERVHRSFRAYLSIFAALTWFLTILGIVIGGGALAMSIGCGIWALIFTGALVWWEETKP